MSGTAWAILIPENEAGSVALHDCDITTYNRDLLARLVYPVANPYFNYEFCKGYYPRIREGSLSGRVTRLLITPLLKTFKKFSVIGITLNSLMFLDTLWLANFHLKVGY